MINLILTKGCTTLKNSGVIGESYLTYQYRLVLTPNNDYLVHVEQHNGYSIAEGILYEGNNLETANKVYDKYSKQQELTI